MTSHRPVGLELLSPEWDDRILAWRHTDFNVHSLVRAKTSVEAEPVGKYMIRQLLSLERLSLDEKEGQVSNRYRKASGELERMDYLEFVALGDRAPAPAAPALFQLKRADGGAGIDGAKPWATSVV